MQNRSERRLLFQALVAEIPSGRRESSVFRGGKHDGTESVFRSVVSARPPHGPRGMVPSRGHFELRRIVTVLLVVMFVLAGRLNAQDQGSGVQEPNPAAPRLGATVESWWRFGMSIKSGGRSTGMVGTVPVPIDWPEQTVEEIAQQATDNTRKLSYNKLTKSMRQLVIKVNRLGEGDTATASVVFKISKRMILAPEKPELLSVSRRPPSSLRQYLKPSPYIESSHPRIKQIAESLEWDASLSDFDNIERIYRWVRDNVEYEFDPVIHPCLDALDAGKGDCEELSSLFIAICRAKGIPARAVWIPGHTYPEFYMEDPQGEGHWLPCQAAGEYSFGQMIEAKPILQKGDRFRLPGQREPLRYVQPMLTARDSSGGLSIEWIMNPLSEEEAQAYSR